jgi:hypothetical protein
MDHRVVLCPGPKRTSSTSPPIVIELKTLSEQIRFDYLRRGCRFGGGRPPAEPPDGRDDRYPTIRRPLSAGARAVPPPSDIRCLHFDRRQTRFP